MSRYDHFSRRRLAFVALLILTALPIAAMHAAAAEQQLLFEDSFERGSGAPTSIVRSFSVSPQIAGPFTMTIVNGEPDPRRAGAMTNLARGTVRLNGVAVAAPGDFTNQSTF